uniref:coiled-coil domain-containing protein 85C isoform X1 n=1 Tax=Ciona intestinalis TaxID=7719 RepID=UPI000180B21D|nr:coiled-coil domain-containing protein 85C isoform X1 [Ciona intestinalis]|eukprot:XP_002129974.1 coiled-coil domain-containing protein 85C isoform X1 [Ciona intestinalis]
MEYHQQSSPSSSSSTSSPSSRGSDVGCLRSPTDIELRHEGLDHVIQRLRFAENENKKLLVERSRAMKDVNRKLQVHLLEVRGVREVNQKLMLEKDALLKEKEELAGICCFLDDDREKAKKVAREWQMFGRYATGVLQKELATCHQKIKDLELKQTTLVQENKTLKEICLMLDQENAGNRSSVDSQSSFPPPPNLLHTPETRDSGDGSSNGSTASNYSPDHHSRSLTKDNLPLSSSLQNDSYLRHFEHRMLRSDEPKVMVKRITVPPSPPATSTHDFTFSNLSTNLTTPPMHSMPSDINRHRNHTRMPHLSSSDASLPPKPTPSQKPEAIVHAMKVLQLHDQLDKDTEDTEYPLSPVNNTILDDKEKAMVREMCNVVWRKLGDKGKGKLASSKPGLQKTASVSNL